jgi:hypothetical protein
MNLLQLKTWSIPMLRYRLSKDLKRCEAKKKFFSTIKTQRVLEDSSRNWLKKELATDKLMLNTLDVIQKLKRQKITNELRYSIILKHLAKRSIVSSEICLMKAA